MKSEDVIAALRTTYCQPKWALFTEVVEGLGFASRRRADAIAVNMWESGGFEIRGFEVKVSKADLRNELKDPSKAEAISQYCDTFILATPKGLTKDEELPESWGVLEVSDSGSVRIKKQPQRNKNPVELSREFFASLCRSSAKSAEVELEALVRNRVLKVKEKHAQQVNAELERRQGYDSRKVEQFEQLFSNLSQTLGQDASRLVHDENFLTAVAAVHALGVSQTYSGIGRIHKDLAMVMSTCSALNGVLGDHLTNLKNGEAVDGTV
ncbi:MmcB family DNA repair protein [Pseudovibrio sp. Tun.PSC04-5.I4]|uniref:MmcB family DNA repair protein n=1 Tax=Pseudovibrio sp. Tun.PSC04-5.I4 TaxID=1798213 RepID=UPI000881565E|nr:MmcB family DNA repair protein [Pseudovibrio sp. Tun.PSC04-5.I4]SDQ99338.1 Protein of unknown function [Pseudovibrio sp. Tun.PSC04-5.I4]